MNTSALKNPHNRRAPENAGERSVLEQDLTPLIVAARRKADDVRTLMYELDNLSANSQKYVIVSRPACNSES